MIHECLKNCYTAHYNVRATILLYSISVFSPRGTVHIRFYLNLVGRILSFVEIDRNKYFTSKPPLIIIYKVR